MRSIATRLLIDKKPQGAMRDLAKIRGLSQKTFRNRAIEYVGLAKDSLEKIAFGARLAVRKLLIEDGEKWANLVENDLQTMTSIKEIYPDTKIENINVAVQWHLMGTMADDHIFGAFDDKKFTRNVFNSGVRRYSKRS